MKDKIRGYEIVIGVLGTVAVLTVFQIFYKSGHDTEEILGVKRGEWLLFFATLGLWFATWRLVQGAELTAERQLRAYLHVISQTVKKKGPSESEPLSRSYSKILGKLRLTKSPFDQGRCTSVSDRGLIVTRTEGAHENPDDGPGLENTMTIGVEVSQDEVAALNSGGMAACLHGNLRYIDAFDHVDTLTLRQRGAAPFHPVKTNFCF